ncbi:MAG: hypothetical protein HRT77_08690 [Halioglobus sp.]|nr:hypothetical protein [Halioglobus sp.]
MWAERTLLVLLGLLFSENISWAQQPSYALGNAYDRDSGKLLYSEQHACDTINRQCIVLYKDTAGNVIAEKELDYTFHNSSPALVMVDYRRDTEVIIPFSGASDLVVDAGFDNFVREQWDSLIAEKAVRFRFRVIGFDSPLNMKVVSIPNSHCSDSQLCLSVNIDSWLLRNFVDPIQLYYSREDRTLQRYSGVSNLKEENGASMQVDIFYDYENR